MSTSHKPESFEPREFAADFVGDQFDETRHMCRQTMLKHGEIRYLAHYSQGIFDFYFVARDVGEHNCSAVQRLGRRLGFAASVLDRQLQEARTGALIRIVLHSHHGAVVCISVVPGQNLVGLCVDPTPVDRPELPLSDTPDVRTIDKAVSQLASDVRARISLPSLNPGGWASVDAVRALTYAEPPGNPYVEVSEGFSNAKIYEACLAAVRPEDLQLVAYCANGTVVVLVDQFDHPSLRPFFTQMTTRARRDFYRAFSHELSGIMRRLDHTASSGGPGGKLVRVVLDVEQGAIYYYRLGVDTYLVGVTVDQDRVRGADERLARLALECAG